MAQAPNPQFVVTPARPSAASDGPTTVDVLVRITPAAPEVQFVRPPINLALVLDRSGSMSAGGKMAHARAAASFAVEQLLPTDRVALTIFDSEVETIAPSAPVADKARLIDLIGQVQPRGATALHAGWKEGANQVERNFIVGGLNRAILLSDGQANEGMTDPTAIAGEARGLAARGVSTTTMGLGDDYNEDLMQAMAESADGNYYFIENPQQLADIFHTELKGLMANTGRKVSLGIEPTGGAVVAEVLNDLKRTDHGRLMLPNLVAGMPLTVVVRLRVPALAGSTEVCQFRLAWDDPKGGGRRSTRVALTLGAQPEAEVAALPVDPEVAEQVALLMAARAKREAIAAFDRDDMVGTVGSLNYAQGVMGAMPMSASVASELADIDQLQADLAAGQGSKFRKRSLFQSFRKNRGEGT